MLKMVRNELLKMFSGKRMYIFIVISFLYVIGTLFSTKHMIENVDTIKAQIPANLNVPDVPEIVLNGFSATAITLDGVSSFLLIVYVIVLAASSITDEYRNGTLKMPLLQGVTRAAIICSKLMALSTVIVFFLFFNFIVTIISGSYLFGFGQQFILKHPSYGEVKLSVFEGIGALLQMNGATLLFLLAIAAIVMYISIKIDSTANAIGIGVGLLLAINIIGSLGLFINPYFIFGYTKFHEKILNQDGVLLGIVVLLTHFGLFAVLSLYDFKKKDIVH
ncbi:MULTISPECIES: ABC transporter permease subunit [unclassified Bacillus cereus group]|uniref:ABC transporter permease subunit n=1 Tax=unclassified Bacillus cereus group TaxID=2750818 RepID=UPI001F58CD85|nr:MULTISPECIES: ABC transporter permease subunit [unclassified Bacillus cereus group]